MKNFLFVYKILDTKEQYKFHLLVFFFLLSTIFEIFGIGLFLPLIKTIIDPAVLNNQFFTRYSHFYSFETQNDLIIFLCTIIFILFSLKTFFTIFCTIFFNRFIASKQKKISNSLIRNYLSEKYIFFLNTNSATLIQNSLNETSQITYNYLTSLILFISEFFFLIGVIIFLLIINPIETIIVVSFFFLIFLIFYNLFKKKYIEYGIIRNENDTKRYQTLEETFGSIKDIILKDKSLYFLEKFNDQNNKSIISNQKVQIYQSLPRILFEFIFIFLFVAVVIYLTERGTILILLPTLGVIAAICFRTIPSINKILNSLNNIKYATKSIEIVLSEINKYDKKPNPLKKNTEDEILFNNNVELKNICFKYPNSEIRIFENLNFLIKKILSSVLWLKVEQVRAR